MSFEKQVIRDCVLYRGDCLEVLPTLGKVDAVVTSPPYAMQRSEQYESISEESYPQWMLTVCGAIKLNDGGNIIINIREHVVGGMLSDYVHKTRLELRKEFIECDEIIWIKPDPAPLGCNFRPRRGWERVLWFSNSRKPFVDCKANGGKSDRVGWDRSKVDWINSKPGKITTGTSRHTDYCIVPVCKDTYGHPATFPIGLADWLIKGWSSFGATILDPFMGSGTTGVACVKLGRKFIGIELEPKYFDIACRRIEKAYVDQAIFDLAEPVARYKQPSLLEPSC